MLSGKENPQVGLRLEGSMYTSFFSLITRNRGDQCRVTDREDGAVGKERRNMKKMILNSLRTGFEKER